MSKRFWTEAKCKRFADRCATRTEMLRRFPRPYDAAVNHKWLNSIFADHPNQGRALGRKPSGYWTKDRLVKKAALCADRREFQSRFSSAYGIAWKKGLIPELFAGHLNEGFDARKRRNGYWQIKANCARTAKKCKTRTELLKRFRGAYTYVKPNQIGR